MNIPPSLPPSMQPIAPVERRVQNPVHGTEGEHFATMLQVFGEGRTPKGSHLPNSLGASLGLGVNDKKEYFAIASVVGNATPMNTGYARAIRDTSDSDVLGRDHPLMLVIGTSQPVVTLAGKLGPLPVSNSTFVTATNASDPVGGINISLGGVGTATSASLPPERNGTTTGITVANVYQHFDNRPGAMDAHVVEGVTRALNMGKGDADRFILNKDTEGLRGFDFLDKKFPSLFSSVVSVGRSHADGAPPPVGLEQLEVIVTKPLNPDNLPPALEPIFPTVKAVLDKVVGLQGLPDRGPLIQYLADIEASPQLKAAMQTVAQSRAPLPLPTETVTAGASTPKLPSLPGPALPPLGLARTNEDETKSAANSTLRLAT